MDGYDRNKAALPPGTARAREQGCTCRLHQLLMGRVKRRAGWQMVKTFTITTGCPLHDFPEITAGGEAPWRDQPEMVDDTPHTQL